MNNGELKKKIVDILHKDFIERLVTPVFVEKDGKETVLPKELCEIFNDITEQALIPYFADALIAAGIGDVKEAEHRAEVAELVVKNLNDIFTFDYQTVFEQAEKTLPEERK